MSYKALVCITLAFISNIELAVCSSIILWIMHRYSLQHAQIFKSFFCKSIKVTFSHLGNLLSHSSSCSNCLHILQTKYHWVPWGIKQHTFSASYSSVYSCFSSSLSSRHIWPMIFPISHNLRSGFAAFTESHTLQVQIDKMIQDWP